MAESRGSGKHCGLVARYSIQSNERITNKKVNGERVLHETLSSFCAVDDTTRETPFGRKCGPDPGQATPSRGESPPATGYQMLGKNLTQRSGKRKGGMKAGSAKRRKCDGRYENENTPLRGELIIFRASGEGNSLRDLRKPQ